MLHVFQLYISAAFESISTDVRCPQVKSQIRKEWDKIKLYALNSRLAAAKSIFCGSYIHSLAII